MKIAGTGRALPKQVVTNAQLTEILDTSDEWIVSHTGIRERRILSEETLEDIAFAAANAALDDAQLTGADMDLILCCNMIATHLTPGLGCLVAGAVNAACPVLDINGACTGFVQALDVADSYLRAGKARRILIVAAEKATYLADWTDRATCVLFGDGAGAVVVEGDGAGLLMASTLKTESNIQFLNAVLPPSRCPYTKAAQPESALYMNGQEVYRFAVSACIRDLNFVIEQAGITMDDVDCYLLHQANSRILEAARTRLRQPAEKFPTNIARLGNTSSACIPILLSEMRDEGKLHEGMTLAFAAFGAGLSHGAALLTL